jgi:hypothetical protein
MFTALMFVLGIAWAFGKASVFKYISDDYPHNIGTISGIVGLAGGLGGFVLPIMFGALMDLTGIRSSAFMLMYGVVWVSLIWMYWTEVRRDPGDGCRTRPTRPSGRLHALKPLGVICMTAHQGQPSQGEPHGFSRLTHWNPEDKAFWDASRATAMANATCGSPSPPCSLAFAVWHGVERGGGQPARPGLQVQHQPALLAGRAARAVGRHAAHLLLASCRAHLRRPALDGHLHRHAADPALGIGFAVQDTHAYDDADAGAAVRLWRRQLCQQHGQHQLLLPEGAQGLALGVNAGLGNLGVSVVQFLVPLVITAGCVWRAGG